MYSLKFKLTKIPNSHKKARLIRYAIRNTHIEDLQLHLEMKYFKVTWPNYIFKIGAKMKRKKTKIFCVSLCTVVNHSAINCICLPKKKLWFVQQAFGVIKLNQDLKCSKIMVLIGDQKLGFVHSASRTPKFNVSCWVNARSLGEARSLSVL